MHSFAKTFLVAGTVLLAFSVLAHEETISPKRLLEVVDIGNPAVSPDGSKVAYRTEQASVERNTYDTIWYVQELGGDSRPHRWPTEASRCGIPRGRPCLLPPLGRRTGDGSTTGRWSTGKSTSGVQLPMAPGLSP